MNVFPGLPPIQSNPVISLLHLQDRSRVNWDMWRNYAATHTGTGTTPTRAHTPMSKDPSKGQRFDAYA